MSILIFHHIKTNVQEISRISIDEDKQNSSYAVEPQACHAPWPISQSCTYTCLSSAASSWSTHHNLGFIISHKDKIHSSSPIFSRRKLSNQSKRVKMLLKTVSSSSSSALSLVNFHGVKKDVSPLLSSISWNLRVSSGKSGNLSFSVRASKSSTTDALSGVVFEPFKEVKKELDLVPTSSHLSLARQKYSDECEAAINEQIK